MAEATGQKPTRILGLDCANTSPGAPAMVAASEAPAALMSVRREAVAGEGLRSFMVISGRGGWAGLKQRVRAMNA
jgi:hypothetical protein